MKLWNRSGAGKGGASKADPLGPADAVHVRGPQIRTRYFGFGVRPATSATPAADATRPSLLSRFGFGGKAGSTYAGTRIQRSAETPPQEAAPERNAADDDLMEKIFGVAETETSRKPPKKPVPPAIRKPKAKKKKLDRSDVALAALGVTLALICALFPWYIFFNQEQFGVREFVFEGRSSATPSRPVAYQPKLVGKPFSTGEVPKLDLDFFPTATLPDESDPVRAVPASEQPFPLDLVTFRLVHVANGRAMIEDEDGLWVVQPGSRLPDASRVVSIEQRNGNWVLVTSLDRIVELAN